MNVQAADAGRDLRARNLRTVGLLAGLFLLPLALSFWLYYGLHWHPAAMTNHGELIEPPRPLPALPAPPRLVVPGSPADLERESAAGAARTAADAAVARPGAPPAARTAADALVTRPGAPAAHTDAAGPAAGAGTSGLSPARETLFRARWTLVYIGDGACDADCRAALYFMRQTRLSLNNDMTRVRRVFLATGAAPDEDFLAREHAGLIVVRIRGPELAALLAQFPAADRPHSLYVVDPLGNLMMRYDDRRTPKGLLEDLKKLLQLSHIG